MIIRIIIAAVLILLAVISLIPISCGIYFRWHESETEFDLELKYGFIKIKLPRGGDKQKPKKEPEKEKPKKEKPEKEAEKKPKKKLDIGAIVSYAWDSRAKIKRLIAAVLGYIIKRMIKINKLKIRLVIGLDDAMQTALIFGAANSVIFGAVGLMDRYMRLGSHSVKLKPAFNEPHIFTEDEVEISTSIFNVLALAVVALWYALPLIWGFVKMLLQNKKDNKKEQNTEQKMEGLKNGKSDQGTDTNRDNLA
ncbi:MAG: DUF2953 domain-containing protein [Clostridia bacterium]|nr:DUF2953 domain-containing protein [Clostridia bacterium]